jgi:hypothetical protein
VARKYLTFANVIESEAIVLTIEDSCRCVRDSVRP